MEFKLDAPLGYVINKTALALKNELGRRFKPYDITVEQWRVLNRLWEKDGLTQKELAEQIFKDQPNTTRILDKLQNKGIIRREASPDDRRAFIINLTGEGRMLRAQLLPVACQMGEDVFTGISEEEQLLLKVLLNKICANIDTISADEK
ncbi:MarR family winged helix-turn-helix transcriptional regulator [Geotalea uraniireducens]|uniref:Transcriptional regulator, MarR family n=1 Tax=Geotalea uraniireducens (strain Rf4) TaxID=351605 RepID=A5GAR3_GEOUR|nr:MarR family transcriptional regulator [Geotalea uraniireducens]ABQ25335.1 transcriptional regulator, MarR family [Geotalea uraniireducens Rf4]